MEIIKINFNKHFYHIDVVKKAAEDYKEFCNCSFAEDDSFVIVSMIPKEDVPLEVKNEFCNYVLGLMKNSGPSKHL